MARVLVFQHVAAEPLGTLDPMLRQRGHRIRYVNFHRDPGAQPKLDRYQGLIVLGGPMMPDQAASYPHLATEIRCIEQALKQDMPVLGICLGAQLLAHALGAPMRPAKGWEIGWYDLKPTAQTAADPVLCGLVQPQPVFQWHRYTFGLPDRAVHLARTELCENQAFRYGAHAYGFQFHLELDERLINRWLRLTPYRDEIAASGVATDADTIRAQTHEFMPQSIRLSKDVFGAFLAPLGEPVSRHVLPSR